MSYFFLVEISTADRSVPVIAENVGPYASLADALDAWPGFREATGDEYDRYVAYWNAYYENEENK